MSIQNPFDGSCWTGPEHAAGYASVISNPQTRLSTMVSSGLYYEELSVTGDTDVLLISAESYLISAYKSWSVQKLLQNFVVRATQISGQLRLRWVHRSLSLSLTTEAALKSIGVNIVVSDDFSGAMTTQNQQLAGIYIQILKT